VVAVDELVAGFDLGRVSPSPAFFDYDKLNWMNGEYIRALPREELVTRALPFGQARYGDRLDPAVFAGAMAVAQERATTLADAARSPRDVRVDGRGRRPQARPREARDQAPQGPAGRLRRRRRHPRRAAPVRLDRAARPGACRGPGTAGVGGLGRPLSDRVAR